MEITDFHAISWIPEQRVPIVRTFRILTLQLPLLNINIVCITPPILYTLERLLTDPIKGVASPSMHISIIY